MDNSTLARHLLHTLGDDERDAHLITSSYDNVVVRSDKRIFRWSLNKSFDDVTHEANFVRFLYKNGVKTEEVLDVSTTTIQGKDFPLMVSSYIDHDSRAPLSDRVVQQAAEELYAIHTFGETYCSNHHYRQRRSLDELLVQMDAQLQNNLSPDAANRPRVVRDIKWALSFIQHSSRVTPSSTVLHNDFRPQNVLMRGDEVAAVIDFDYSVATTTPQKDVAHAALEWSFPDAADAPDMATFQLFVESYAAMNNESYDTYTQRVNLLDWVKVSALIDAAGYWLYHPEKTAGKFGSYMYTKYLYFCEETYV